jgi:hypothetical protein
MKKAPKIEYGITITKPWSKEMYDHNDAVAVIVREKIALLFAAELAALRKDDMDWVEAPESLKAVQKAITCYGFGYGYTVGKVAEIVWDEIDEAPLYRLKDIAEELELQLEMGFIGFNS